MFFFEKKLQLANLTGQKVLSMAPLPAVDQMVAQGNSELRLRIQKLEFMMRFNDSEITNKIIPVSYFGVVKTHQKHHNKIIPVIDSIIA